MTRRGSIDALAARLTGLYDAREARSIALAAVAIAGGMLIFGGELNDFARRLVYIVLVAGILLGATQIVALFGSTGASIGIDSVAGSSASERGEEGRDG